jgi:hypothetical protein
MNYVHARYDDDYYESFLAQDYDHLVLYPLAGLSWMVMSYDFPEDDFPEDVIHRAVLIGCYLPMAEAPYLDLLGSILWPMGFTSSASAGGRAYLDEQCRRLHAVWRLGLAPEPR